MRTGNSVEHTASMLGSPPLEEDVWNSGLPVQISALIVMSIYLNKAYRCIFRRQVGRIAMTARHELRSFQSWNRPRRLEYHIFPILKQYNDQNVDWRSVCLVYWWKSKLVYDHLNFDRGIVDNWGSCLWIIKRIAISSWPAHAARAHNADIDIALVPNNKQIFASNGKMHANATIPIARNDILHR